MSVGYRASISSSPMSGTAAYVNLRISSVMHSSQLWAIAVWIELPVIGKFILIHGFFLYIISSVSIWLSLGTASQWWGWFYVFWALFDTRLHWAVVTLTQMRSMYALQRKRTTRKFWGVRISRIMASCNFQTSEESQHSCGFHAKCEIKLLITGNCA